VTVRDLLVAGTEELDRAGVPSPRVDAEWLLAHALGVSRTDLYADGDDAPADRERAFRELVARRAAREPLAYVLGEWGFRRLTLRVDPRVLIPRPETEVLVERCLELIADRGEPAVLDIGTGSGAIALAIADEHPGARVVGTDTSADALAVAAENVALTGLRVELVQGELFAGLDGPFGLAVSNPPYVAPEDLGKLEAEVRDWEPHQALVGTGASEAIAAGARRVLGPGGALVLEVADGTAPAVCELLRGLGYREVRATTDLTGRDRVAEGLL
jgi:release factor glutamine methyltransferase